MNIQGRGIAAEKLGLEALDDLKKANNVYGVAEAHTFLGLFYKSKSYRAHSDFYTKHGEYDPTATKSIYHFEEAAKAFNSDGDLWGVSKAYFGMGNSYITDNDNINGCLKFKESLEIYNSEENVFKGRIHPHNPNYKSFDAMIESFIVKYCESGV